MIRSAAPLVVVAALLCPIYALQSQSGESGTLVVVNKQASTANIIDLASRRILATLPTGTGPHEVVTTGDGRTAVVTDYAGGNSLTVIDVPGLRVVRTIDLSAYSRPHGIAFLPGDSLVAVTSEATQNVVIVRVSDGEILSVISTDQDGSHMLAIVGSGRVIFTSNIGSNSVSELDLETGSRTRTFSVPPRPEAITVTRDGAEVWVGSNDQGTVNVVDTRSGEVVEAAQGLEWPYRILITPNNRLVLIPDLRKHQLRILDRASRRQLAVLDLPNSGPQGITLSGDGRTIFHALSAQDRVAIIDLETRQITGYVETGDGPDGVAYSRLVLVR